jgi:NAD-dependent SIR2 family protein deacetylase
MNLKENKKKSLDFLINKAQESHSDVRTLPKCSLLLGAGCSRSSQIPTGGEIIDLLRKLWFLAHYPNGNNFKISTFEIDEEKFSEISDEFQTKYLEIETQLKEKVKIKVDKTIFLKYLSQAIELTDKSLLVENIFQDELYGFWFEMFSENPRDRQQIIEYLIEKGAPAGAYLLLAHMIAKKKFMNIFTTNFDDLLNDSLIKYTDQKPRVYAHNEISCYINPLNERPNIIKLHGDFLFENIKNISGETKILEPNMKLKLEEALKNNIDLIVIGFNGADDSVMNALSEIKENSPFAVYWCGRKEDKLNWKVKAFLNYHPNAYFIEIESFEYLVFKLFQRFEIELPDFAEYAKIKQEEFDSFLSDFEIELTNTPELDDTQKEDIKSSFKIVLNRNSFFEFQNLTSDKEKLEYLNNLRIDGISRTLKNIHTNISWNEAKRLFELIDTDNFFLNKVKDAPIQHVSNSFSNLKKIDKQRTYDIIDSIPNKVLIQKLSEANDNDAYAGIYELSAIHPEKLKEIKKQRSVSEEIDFKTLDLRSIIFKLKTVSVSSAKLVTANEFTIISEKLNNSDVKEITLFLSNLWEILPKEASQMLNSLDIEKLSNSIVTQNFNQVGMSIALYTKLDKKFTSLLIENLNFKKLALKASKLPLSGIQNALREINQRNNRLALQLFNEIPDELFIEKIKQSDLISIAEAINNLKKINQKRIHSIINKIDDTFFLELINKSEWTYQHFGNVHEKLLTLDYNRFAAIARKVNIDEMSASISSTMNKTGQQIFLHLIPTFFKANKFLLAAIINKCSQEYIDSILTWDKIDLYTVNLPFLKRIFEQNEMSKEMALVEYIISENQNRFEKKKRKKTKYNNGYN